MLAYYSTLPLSTVVSTGAVSACRVVVGCVVETSVVVVVLTVVETVVLGAVVVTWLVVGIVVVSMVVCSSSNSLFSAGVPVIFIEITSSFVIYKLGYILKK